MSSTHADLIRGLQVGLSLVSEKLVTEPQNEPFLNAKRTLVAQLDRVQRIADVRSLKDAAHVAGISYEGMRLRLRTRCPEAARACGRKRLTPDIVARLLAD